MGPASSAVTRGFETIDILVEKFHRHVRLRHEFNHQHECEYLSAANAFLTVDRGPGVWECYRRNGDLLRYNELTNEFGILRADGVIKTYFRPDPDEHRRASNLEYFRLECRK